MGILTDDMILQALLNPTPVVIYGNAWSFVDTNKYETSGVKYLTGHLVKYKPDAQIKIVDPEKHVERVQQEPNMRLASSPFVYIPSHAGVAFLRVSGQIAEWHFIDRFARIIEDTHHRFFVECELNLIADMKTFAVKLSSLSGIYRISAKVVPPNPLFGPLWKSLRDYIKLRRSGQMVIREESKSTQPLNTALPELVAKVAAQPEGVPFIVNDDTPIGDAAILMAADGYGTGQITGMSGGRPVVIRTADSNKSFEFDKDPRPEELFARAFELFEKIAAERHLEH